ncbi:MAG: tricarballylate utilization 4Fe-4S protein TcuB [Vicinamibacterales bacterium]
MSRIRMDGPTRDSAPRFSRPTTLPDAERELRVCNACRYCEGYCAVFPAMERRLTFTDADVQFLANLCHDCGECLDACQYAPPHEFGVNLPDVFASVRRHTYATHARPRAFARLFAHDVAVAAGVALVVPALTLTWLMSVADAGAFSSAHADAEGAFYAVVPHGPLVATFGALAVLVAWALVAGPLAFWRELGEPTSALLDGAAWRRAAVDALTLRYLHGGGAGCGDLDDRGGAARRRFHHCTAYGLLLCVVSTTMAAVYHNVMGWRAPYPVLSVPVVLGLTGGAGLIVGPTGLLWLAATGRARRAPAQASMDVVFVGLLFVTSVTGFALLWLRESAMMGVALAVHLGVVAGLLATLPYGKFVHATYRLCALVKHARESASSRRGSE